VVAAGLLGQIRVIRTAFTFQLEAASDNYRLDPSRGGGALLDAGTYGVSLARWLLNEEPTTVQAEAVYGSSGIDQTMVATLRFASGCLAMVEASFEAALQQTYAVVGSEAAVELPHDAFIPWEKPAHFRLRCGKDPEGQLETVAGVDEYRRMVEHFADAVLGRTSLAYTPDDSVHNMEVLDAIARAARERRPVALQ
jgi:predicted dehydrogenase